MAEKSEGEAISDLVPSKVVETLEGERIDVPVDNQAARQDNMVLIAQLRSMVREQLKRYKDGDERMSPKDVKDMVEASARIIELSGGAYGSNDTITKFVQKNLIPAPKKAIQFGVITKDNVDDKPVAPNP